MRGVVGNDDTVIRATEFPVTTRIKMVEFLDLSHHSPHYHTPLHQCPDDIFVYGTLHA